MAAPTLLADRQLGRTGLTVSKLAFGAAPLGDVYGCMTDQDAERTVHAAIDVGLRCFDVAPYYGATLAETRLGRALAGRRDSVVLATKCGRLGVDRFDFSAAGIRECVEGSLRRLKTEAIDLLQLHDVEFGDLNEIVNESIPALLELKRRGIARAIGITGLPLKLLTRLAASEPIDTVLTYCHGSLLASDLTRDLLPTVRSRGIGLLNASPLHMGLLTGAPPPDWHPAPTPLVRVAAELHEICRRRLVDLPAIASRFATELPVDVTIVGLSSVREVEAAVRAVSTPIEPTLRTELLTAAVFARGLGWHSGRPENQD